MRTLKVSATSKVTSVAASIAACIKDDGEAIVQGMGARAVNQAVKAISLANIFLKNSNKVVCCIPEFDSVELDGQTMTVMRFKVFEQKALSATV